MYHPTLSSPVTRRIWGSPDAILLFFAGGAAEFAAIKAVDWLFFTGRLPRAPVDRFFETVRFAQGVFFCDPAGASVAVERINRIHRRVEQERGEEIPQWAYRDMLFILIDYGERAHEVVFGPMTEAERRGVECELLYDLEVEYRKVGWGDPAYVYDGERGLFRFRDGRFAFPRGYSKEEMKATNVSYAW